MSRRAARVVATVGLALAAAAVGWMGWRDRPRTALDSRARDERIARSTDAPTAASPATVASPRPANDAVHIAGTIAYFAEEGDADPRDRGALTLRIVAPRGAARAFSVPVDGGRFDATVPRGAEIAVTDIVLDDRELMASPSDRFVVPDDGDLVVFAVAEPSVRWHVVDAETRENLSEVTIVRTPVGLELFSHSVLGGRSGQLAEEINVPGHPGISGAAEVLLASRTSPFRLPMRESFDLGPAMFVSAPGYAWARIPRRIESAELTVALERGGDLRIELRNYRPAGGARDPSTRAKNWNRDRLAVAFEFPTSQAVLSLAPLVDSGQASTHSTIEGVPPPDGPTLVSGLPPGTYAVAMTISPESRSPIVLARADVEIVAGATTEVVLELDDPPAGIDGVPLSGTLSVAPGWGPFDLDVVFSPLEVPGIPSEFSVPYPRVRTSALVPVVGVPGLFEWSAGRVLPGRYRAAIGSLPPIAVVEVGERGEENARLVLGERVHVTVRVVCASDGEAIAGVPLMWRPMSCDAEVAWASLGWIEGYGSAGRFACPAGEIEIRSVCHRVEPFVQRVVVGPGDSELAIPAIRTCGIVIRIESPVEEARQFCDTLLTWYVRLTRVGSKSGADAIHTFADFIYNPRMRVPEPGRYEVVIEPIEGFEEIEPFVVEVAAGEWVERPVEFRRFESENENE